MKIVPIGDKTLTKIASNTNHTSNHGYRNLWEVLKSLFKKEPKKLKNRKKVSLVSLDFNNSGGMKMTKKPTNETTNKKAASAAGKTLKDPKAKKPLKLLQAQH